ncbi:hypothetical protein [Cognaticolwellia beringensis]|uniref:Uncharacterized protein n=1 Tax=Cognaticolwellia beringensis TaxID=1967665 RepID=A0A222GA46_9GAMM|nr:hypothetical protein [Cognaticolwellia beringensis]ASP48671.1 hypothetical protein B5D82_13365 [Cognaticolwellia beringensis]
MEVLIDLLPASYTAKAEPSAKDSRQKQARAHDKKKPNLTPEHDEAEISEQKEVENERRTGDDRREQTLNRGRWLESRDRKDRRENESAICVKI